MRLGHVALDGTKVRACASKHKAMSYGRMRTTEAALQGELPDWVTHKQTRIAKIRAALEAEAAAAKDQNPHRSDNDPPPPPTTQDGTPRTAPNATSPIPTHGS